MIKKFTIVLLSMLCLTWTATATEIWSGSCTIGDWSGSNITVEKAEFSSAVAGDIIRLTIDAFAESYVDGESQTQPITQWTYQLQQKDNSWATLTDFTGGDIRKGSKHVSYVLTDNDVTTLKAQGLAVNGQWITVSKVELVSQTSENINNVSTTLGDESNWGNLQLTYGDKGNLAKAQKYDVICVTYTVNALGAAVQVQTVVGEWLVRAYKYDNTYVAEGNNTGRVLYCTIYDATMLEMIQHAGIAISGIHATVTSVDLLKPTDRYNAVPLTIGSDGIATFGSDYSLDFSSIANVTPYYVSSVETGRVHLTSVETTRKWAGYIVQGTAGTYDIPVAASDPAWISEFDYLIHAGDYDNSWVYRSAYSGYSGEDSRATKIKTYFRYIFAKDNSGNIGFYKLATDYSRVKDATTVYYHELAAHKAYLETPTDITPGAGSAPAIHLVFDEENGATAVEQFEANDEVQKFVENGQLFIRKNGVTYDLMGRAVK